ncbi:hypothetical protein BOTCAL_0557g00030 [Botryotinia calthae]|uniref:Uncharacterized protein n=1 Tax=Botryotinia calthae TaxID=38488 RepID=A0A4Y8CMJ8_9HELO|nr:hypothetical protein BOTCAL_0557g00030 [Botryotinia calthae]
MVSNAHVVELHQYEEIDQFNDESCIKIFVQGFGVRFEVQYPPGNLKASPYQLSRYEKSLRILALGDMGYSNWDAMDAMEEANKLKELFRALMDSLLINQAIPVPSNCTARDCLQAIQYVLEAKCNGDTLLPTLKGQLARQSVTDTDTGTKFYYERLLLHVLPGKDWIHKRVMDAFDAGKLPTTMPICRIQGIVVADIEELLENYKPKSETGLNERWGYTKDDCTIIPSPNAKCMPGYVLSYIENKGTLYDIAP